MSYKVTIINNENNEVLLDLSDARAIIGAVSEEEGTHCLGFTNCNGGILLSTLDGVDTAKDSILKNSPEVAKMYMLKGLLDLCESDSDPTNSN